MFVFVFEYLLVFVLVFEYLLKFVLEFVLVFELVFLFELVLELVLELYKYRRRLHIIMEPFYHKMCKDPNQRIRLKHILLLYLLRDSLYIKHHYNQPNQYIEGHPDYYGLKYIVYIHYN